MTSTSPADTAVAEYAGQLFFRLWRASHTRTAAALDSIGLTPPLFAILNFLRERSGAIQGEIGAAMGIDPSTMVALVDELERNGLAKRRPHPKDRRAREIAITPKGRRSLERGRALARAVEDEVLQGLGAGERRELLKLLRQAIATAPPPSSLWSADEDD